jgi:dGTPase
LVGFSPRLADALQTLRGFLYAYMYTHYRVRRMQLKSKRIVRALFEALIQEPDCLPPVWRARIGAPGDATTAIAIADYVAGMTDRYALTTFDRMLNLSSEFG